MADVSDLHQKELPRIKENVEAWNEYFGKENDYFHEWKKFIFETSLTQNDIDVLQTLKKPQIECNILEAYISRLRGEFSKQQPSVNVTSNNDESIDTNLIEVIRGNFLSKLKEVNKDSFEYDIFTDLMGGGYSVAKISTDYENPSSFNQVIKWEKVQDPTMCGFDPLAKLSHKGDGKYWFEVFPKRKEDFMAENPKIDISKINYSRGVSGFNWAYNNNEKDILIICDYYEKKDKKKTLVKLSNGQTLLKDDYDRKMADYNDAIQSGQVIEQAPVVVDKRQTVVTVICRYRIIADQVLEYIETDFDKLNGVFIDGNSVFLRESRSGKLMQKIRAYPHHAKGIQRLKNFAMQTWANDLENMVQCKWKIAKESIDTGYKSAYENIQLADVIVYKAFKDEGGQIPLPPPQEIYRVPMPPEVSNAFTIADKTSQVILGSFDASLGINNNQLSGVAMVEGATQSNAAAMPYIVGFLAGLTRIAEIHMTLLPKYYKTSRSIPIVDDKGRHKFIKINQDGGIDMNYDPNSLNVSVEAGVNFSVQKSKALQAIIALMQVSPVFSQFINTKGLDVLLNNLDIYDIDQLKEMADQFMQEIQQQQKQQQAIQQQQQQMASQNNPVALKQQELQMNSQLKQQELQQEMAIKQQEFGLKQQQNTNDAIKTAIMAKTAQDNNIVELAKAHAEQMNDKTELDLKNRDMTHKHIKEATELLHTISQPDKETKNDDRKEDGKGKKDDGKNE